MVLQPSTGVDVDAALQTLRFTITDLAFVAALLVGSLSVYAVATGEPELIAMAAVAGVAVVLVGSAVCRWTETDAVPTSD